MGDNNCGGYCLPKAAEVLARKSVRKQARAAQTSARVPSFPGLHCDLMSVPKMSCDMPSGTYRVIVTTMFHEHTVTPVESKHRGEEQWLGGQSLRSKSDVCRAASAGVVTL